MPKANRTARLTRRFIEAAAPGPAELNFSDSEVAGLRLRVAPSGVKSWSLVYRERETRRQRRVSLGRANVVTPDQARRLARQALARAAEGEGPAAERDRRRGARTVAEAFRLYFVTHAEPKKKPKSVRNDRQLYSQHVAPALGRMLVSSVTRADVMRLHAKMRATPYQANRTLSLLSKLFNLTEQWGLRPGGSNPCRHVERYREERRRRFLSDVEIARLGDVLRDVEAEGDESPAALAAIRFLLLSGCRLGEALGLTWREVDLENGGLNLTDSKTGPRFVRLAPPALELLSRIPRAGGRVFPGTTHRRDSSRARDGELDLRPVWHRVRERAGLSDVRLHDLRHSFGASAAGLGVSLPVIGALLGHRQPQTTARYAHLADDAVKVAAAKIGSDLASLLDGADRAPVIDLHAPRARPRHRKS